MTDKKCSMPDCAELPRVNQRYCPECHSKYMKAWRAKRKRAILKLQESAVSMRAKIMEQSRELAELKVV